MKNSLKKSKTRKISTSKNKRVGIALGAGGIKGLAHIGVLKVLERHNIHIKAISGTSGGALVGALYSHFGSAIAVETFFLENSKPATGLKLISLTTGSGLLGGIKIASWLRRRLGNVDFKSLQIPLKVVATNADTGDMVVLDSGDVIRAVMASIAAPPVFNAVKYRNQLLTDGGMSNPVPDNLLRQNKVDVVIAVNLENGYFGRPVHKANPIDMLQRSITIMRYHMSRASIDTADVVIEPKVDNHLLLGVNQFFNHKKIKQYIRAGEVAAEEKIRSIQKVLRDSNG